MCGSSLIETLLRGSWLYAISGAAIWRTSINFFCWSTRYANSHIVFMRLIPAVFCPYLLLLLTVTIVSGNCWPFIYKLRSCSSLNNFLEPYCMFSVCSVNINQPFHVAIWQNTGCHYPMLECCGTFGGTYPCSDITEHLLSFSYVAVWWNIRRSFGNVYPAGICSSFLICIPHGSILCSDQQSYRDSQRCL